MTNFILPIIQCKNNIIYEETQLKIISDYLEEAFRVFKEKQKQHFFYMYIDISSLSFIFIFYSTISRNFMQLKITFPQTLPHFPTRNKDSDSSQDSDNLMFLEIHLDSRIVIFVVYVIHTLLHCICSLLYVCQ